jgi:hypothetical protein
LQVYGIIEQATRPFDPRKKRGYMQYDNDGAKETGGRKRPGARRENIMAKQVEHEVAYYYDFHPTEEDLMGETSVHAALIHYLVEVLTWLFHGQVYTVYENLNFYQTSNPKEYPLAPDIALIKGVAFQHVRS